MLIGTKQAAELLGVTEHGFRKYCGRKLTARHTKGGYRRYELDEVRALAKRWAEEKEQEAAELRSRI